jgi:hypothetical protein
VAMVALALTRRLETLTLATLLTGFAYGGLFSATPTIVSERYGVSGFGVNWCVHTHTQKHVRTHICAQQALVSTHTRKSH